MDTFIGIGNKHWRNSEEEWNLSFGFVYDVLTSEKPDLIVAEYGFYEFPVFSLISERTRAQRIEEGRAKIKFDFIKKRIPRITLGGLEIFNEGTCSLTPIESRAAISYALRNKVPVFFVDEPFAECKSFSRNVREHGIIGFQKGKRPNYSVLLTRGNASLSDICSTYCLKERNLFAKAAIETLDAKFSPKIIAGVGGSAHYFFNEEMIKPYYEFFNRQDYAIQYTIPSLIKAKNTRVYDAIEMKLLEERVQS